MPLDEACPNLGTDGRGAKQLQTAEKENARRTHASLVKELFDCSRGAWLRVCAEKVCRGTDKYVEAEGVRTVGDEGALRDALASGAEEDSR